MYAYLDKYGIMHTEEVEEKAKAQARNGKIVKCDLPTYQGYPALAQPVTIKDNTANIFYTLLEKETKISLNDAALHEIKKVYDMLK